MKYLNTLSIMVTFFMAAASVQAMTDADSAGDSASVDSRSFRRGASPYAITVTDSNRSLFSHAGRALGYCLSAVEREGLESELAATSREVLGRYDIQNPNQGSDRLSVMGYRVFAGQMKLLDVDNVFSVGNPAARRRAHSAKGTVLESLKSSIHGAIKEAEIAIGTCALNGAAPYRAFTADVLRLMSERDQQFPYDWDYGRALVSFAHLCNETDAPADERDTAYNLLREQVNRGLSKTLEKPVVNFLDPADRKMLRVLVETFLPSQQDDPAMREVLTKFYRLRQQEIDRIDERSTRYGPNPSLTAMFSPEQGDEVTPLLMERAPDLLKQILSTVFPEETDDFIAAAFGRGESEVEDGAAASSSSTN